MQEKGLDCQAILQELDREGFLGGIDICLSSSDISASRSLTSVYPGIRHAIGMGPWETGSEEDTDSLISRLKSLLECNPDTFSFLGEFGLDYYWKDYGNPSCQIELLEAELELAAEHDLPVIIHDREADSDMEQVLCKHSCPNSGIIHCFSVSRELAFRLLDKGYYISFAGNITYRHSEDLCEVMRSIPKDRLLLETDSPYLAPIPKRGKPNDPRNMVHTYGFAAEILSKDVAQLAVEIVDNFNHLLSFCPNHQAGRQI